jgi:hypothetical protein
MDKHSKAKMKIEPRFPRSDSDLFTARSPVPCPTLPGPSNPWSSLTQCHGEANRKERAHPPRSQATQTNLHEASFTSHHSLKRIDVSFSSTNVYQRTLQFHVRARPQQYINRPSFQQHSAAVANVRVQEQMGSNVFRFFRAVV